MYISTNDEITPVQILTTLTKVAELKILYLASSWEWGKSVMADVFKYLPLVHKADCRIAKDQQRASLPNGSTFTMIPRNELEFRLCGERADIVIIDSGVTEQDMDTWVRPLLASRGIGGHLKPRGIYLLEGKEHA